MSAKKELAGHRFGRLVVVAQAPSSADGFANWECICDCGNALVTSGKRLRGGVTKSCGCLRVDAIKRTSKENITHGKSKSTTWNSWISMRSRCMNKNVAEYKNYGARGISICDKWSDFSAFLADMGERPEGKTLDRIDVNGNYEPGNCRWSTPKEQMRNKRNNRRFGGITVAEIAEKSGVNYVTMRKRLIRNEKAK
jgi:hypothetical protein